jgi:hypothetical protein
MQISIRRMGLMVALAVLSLSVSGAAMAQADPTGLPIIGMWRVNLDKSSPNIRKFRQATWTCEYVVENGGIRHNVYDVYPPPYKGTPTGVAPHDHTYFFKLDGTQAYKDPEGPNNEGQTVAMWLVDRNTIYRQRQTKGEDDERVIYQVSPDGKQLTWFVWSANKPDPKGMTNLIVWDRVN